MKGSFSIVDSDAHIIEPHRIWTEYLEAAYRDRAPRPVGLTFGFEFEGTTVNLPQQWDPAMTPEDRARRSARVQATFAELFPEAYAVLYPSFGLFALTIDGLDPLLAAAVARAYNNWLADFCRTDSQRLQGVAMVSMHDPARAAAEAVCPWRRASTGRRQCYVSADAEEYMLAQVIELMGDDRIVFSTDYPHPDSPWPHAVDSFLAQDGVSTESKRKILWDNGLALYNLDLPGR